MPSKKTTTNTVGKAPGERGGWVILTPGGDLIAWSRLKTWATQAVKALEGLDLTETAVLRVREALRSLSGPKDKFQL